MTSPRRWLAAAAMLLAAFPAMAALRHPASVAVDTTSAAGAVTRSPAPPAAASAMGAARRCGVCHPSERVEFERSRHAQEDVHCTSCHGGNDNSLTLSVAHGSGFKGRPAHKDIPSLCASCHADESRMRPYNLPVDQFALYQTSGHGVRLARGDTRVAVCSDCHGAHAILPPSDPASSVFVLNIPRTCGNCHGDSTLMRSRGRTNAYQEYLASVHARELLDKGNQRAPTCVSCHGVHGAAPPAVGDIDKVCGQCHTAERRYFFEGPHRTALSAAGLPECVSCHGHHNTSAARPERLATSCGTCHVKGTAQENTGRKMWTDYQTASAEIDKAAALITRAEAVPIQTEDYAARIQEARTYLRESMPAAHAVQEDVVSGFTLRARSVGSEVESEIYGKLGNLRTRKFLVILIWFYVLLTVLVLRRMMKQGAAAR